MRTARTSARTRAKGAVAILAASAVTAALLATPASAADSLKQLADARGFDIGFAMEPHLLDEAAYRQIADTEFNYVVAGNAMKWDATEPNQGQFSWDRADQVANYARTSGKGLYGHTLVWHSQLPWWVESLNATQLEAAMINHINEVAGRYAGQVEAWDVVNEAFEDNGQRRNSVFQQRLGDGYIETAFRAARAADPNAKLCINDYSTDAINSKSTAIYNLVRDFKARGVPIDCVGLQSHLIVGQVPSSMRENMQRFADLGVDVRITELDIRMRMPASSSDLAQQARDYQAVFENCLAVDRCPGVTIWGISDRYSWVPDVFSGEGAALVWDDNFQRKPAYDAIATALGGVPPTTPPPTTPPPTTPPPTTPPPTGDGCTAAFTMVNTWPGGFQGEVTVTAGAAAISGWTTGFSFDQGSIVQLWNGDLASSGSTHTVGNLSYNGNVGAGQSTTFGFVGSGPAPTVTNVSCSSR